MTERKCEMTHYNLALLCETSTAQEKLEDISTSLAKTAPSLYILGENSSPHITVCRFKTEEFNIQKIWGAVENIIPTFKIRPTRYYWNPTPIHSGHNYVGIEIICSNELYEYQQKIVNALPSINPLNSIGHQYFPHFTLGCCDLSNHPAITKSLNLNEFWDLEIEVDLALGQSGPEGQFEKTLHKQGIQA